MPPIPDWSRAWGAPLFAARIRTVPGDFTVCERLSIAFTGDGEHDWLRVEKTGCNTQWVAEQLAGFAGVPVRDVGFSGLKDRHAVTTQWFSVRRKIREPADWDRFERNGVRILETHVHDRKLKRGAHRSNAFRIVARGAAVAAAHDDLAERLLTISRHGVPNYFGEQRFGRGGANIDLGRAVLDGRRLPRAKRGIGISALRSFRFNEALAARVRAGTWNSLVAGDLSILDGTRSVFPVDEPTPELTTRCSDMDIHPAGVLPALDAIGVKASYRPLRMRVRELSWVLEREALRLDFTLARGSYATAVLRELIGFSAEGGR